MRPTRSDKDLTRSIDEALLNARVERVKVFRMEALNVVVVLVAPERVASVAGELERSIPRNFGYAVGPLRWHECLFVKKQLIIL